MLPYLLGIMVALVLCSAGVWHWLTRRKVSDLSGQLEGKRCPICGVSLVRYGRVASLNLDDKQYWICDSCASQLDRHPEWLAKLQTQREWEVRVEGTDAASVQEVLEQVTSAMGHKTGRSVHRGQCVPQGDAISSNVFISYAREDRGIAEMLARALNSEDLSVWWDQRIGLGESFDSVIEQALRSARCVVVLWSRHSVYSDWVKAEASEGKRRGILVPVMIDDVETPLEFRRMQAAILIGWSGNSDDQGFVQLREAVKRLAGVVPPSAPPNGNSVEHPEV